MSYDTPQIIFWNAAKASSLGPKCTVPTSNAFGNQQRMLATDTPTTLLAVAMTHYELPGLGLDGRNVDLVQIDGSLPLLPYLRTGTAPGTEPRRSCRELGSLGRPAART